MGTFAVGWLTPPLRSFSSPHPFVELRLMTNNNLVDLTAEGIDCAIRFGDGNWLGTRLETIRRTALAAVRARDRATPWAPAALAEKRCCAPITLTTMNWFAKAGRAPMPARGALFAAAASDREKRYASADMHCLLADSCSYFRARSAALFK